MKYIISIAITVFLFYAGTTISNAAELNGADYCARLYQIKSLPRHDEPIDDGAYNELIDAGEKAIPCLIEKITDTTEMEDPRCPRFTDNFKVGDMAYFVLLDIGGIGFEQMLPAETQELIKTEGAFAYHWYVEEEGNRDRLQDRLKEWYSQRKPQEDK